MKYSNRIKRVIAVLLSAVMLLSLTGCRLFEVETEIAQREFTEYCDELFLEMLGDDTMMINFTLAEPEKYGIKQEYGTLGEFSMDYIGESEQWITDTLEELKKFDATLLTERQQLSLDTLTAYFEKQDAYRGYYMLANPFTTNTGVAANMGINFIEFIMDDEEDVELYLDLLKDTRRYVGQILDFVRQQSAEGYFMPDTCVDKNIEICRNYLDAEISPLIVSFEEKLTALDLPEEKKKEYIATNEQYVAEYFNATCQDIIDTLSELKGTATNQLGLCYFENGKEYYTAIVKEKTSSDMEPEEIIQLLEDEMDQLLTDYQNLYYSNPALLDQAMNLNFGMNSAEEILTFLAENVSKEFPEPYTKEFVVKYQSKGAEIEGTLAYYLTARLDELNYNSIKVNASAFGEDYTQMYSTLAHEGFPGHLYQYTGVFSNEDIPDVCKLLNFIGFTEGFAEYAGDRAYVLAGCSEELTELIVLDNMYGYILQGRIDLGIHYEGWDKEDCAAYCAEYGVDSETSDYVFDVILSDPGLILPYSVGHIKLRNLREEAETELGDAFDAVEFHRLILTTGLVTFEIMEEELDQYIEMKKAENVQ